MQKAQPLKFDETAGGIMGQNITEAGAAEYLAAWKKVAERKIHLIFYSLPIYDPAIPDEMEKAAVDLVGRLTWRDTCEHMSDGEKIAACHANSEAVDEYAWELAKKAAAGQPEQASAAPK